MRSLTFIALAASLAFGSVASTAPAKADDDAIITGAIGFGVGTLFGSAMARPRYYYAPAPIYVAPPPPPVIYEPMPVYYAPAPWTPDWYAYCARKYQSFDARSGTYLGFDGFRHMCQ
jgi:hypothetical protein